MTYSVQLASYPGLNADFKPGTGEEIGRAATIAEAVEIAKREWKPGYSYTIRKGRGRGSKCVRTVWENGAVT